ncbi:MAG: hypothetical protein RBR41_04445 [Desulfovibrio sp.]|uniref:hypothetical protein n=1 Tax=Desulfovibrio sp. TaxID=885 RepID=UPI002A370804|nr:hypothetical protein [Desulfovibrio sp.]MDY0258901.1 hypothetical protein [Desulfovibrio sp.]
MFDENEIRNVFKYEIEKKSISDDPKQYMLERCKELKEIHKDNEDNLKIIMAYMLALEGIVWRKINEKLWDHSKDINNNTTFVSRRLKDFKEIAAEYKIPFIAANIWNGRGKSKRVDRGSIVKNMLEQLAFFYAKK